MTLGPPPAANSGSPVGSDRCASAAAAGVATGLSEASLPAPLGVVLGLTFLNSLGTGVLTNGIFFLTETAFGFGVGRNYGLGVLNGLTYIVGALGAGPALRVLRTRFPGLTERRVLIGLMVLLALLCLLPLAARRLSGSDSPASSSWSAWVMIALYSPLTGALWPITESYLSGGRSGVGLRRAIGGFNIVWSAAVAAAYWCMAPLVEKHPLTVILAVAIVHVGSLVLVLMLPARPAAHDEDLHEPHPDVYPRLLALFRLELPISYLCLSALTPYLPTVLKELGISTGWQTPIASTWLVARVLTFALLQAWHGWHGRWSAAIVGGVLLLVGFSGAVISARLSGVGLPALFVSLAVFGVGMGTIYTAALYYAMSVGKSEVEAGGMHEALIGVGYAAGPGCGLAAYAAAWSGVLPQDQLKPAIIGAVSVISVPTIVWAVRHAARQPRQSASQLGGPPRTRPDP